MPEISKPCDQIRTKRHLCVLHIDRGRKGQRAHSELSDTETARTDTCLALRHFGLLDEVIGNQHVIFCEKHRAVIPFEDLSSHLSAKHRVQCNTMLGKPIGTYWDPTKLLSPLIDHISDALNIVPNQSLSDILRLELALPLGLGHGLPEPRPSLQCPGCSLWFYCKTPSETKAVSHRLKNIQQHVNHSSCTNVGEVALLDVINHPTIRYSQAIFGSIYGPHKKVGLQEGWNPPVAQRPDAGRAASSDASSDRGTVVTI
jgi:hypothetical protein